MAFKTITQVEFIPASPSEVYEAFTNPKKQSEFTGSKATGGDKVGKFTSWGGYIFGKVVELVKDKKVVLEWKTTEWPENTPISKVELTFTSKGTGTELKMVHSQVPSEQSASYEQGWTDYYWKPLKDYFQKKK